MYLFIRSKYIILLNIFFIIFKIYFHQQRVVLMSLKFKDTSEKKLFVPNLPTQNTSKNFSGFSHNFKLFFDELLTCVTNYMCRLILLFLRGGEGVEGGRGDIRTI